MDSVNLIKGYGKLNHLEEQSPLREQPTRKLLIKAIIAVLLTVVILLTIITLTHNSKAKSSSSFSSIEVVCNVTHYPTTCISSLSSTNLPAKSDPIAILMQTLKLAILELQKLESSIKPMISDIGSPEAKALRDCMDLFDDAVSRLQDSVDIMKVGPTEKALNDRTIRDIQTWVSAALTDEQTCLDGLKEVGSMDLEDVKAKMVRSQELTSNSLAIIAHMRRFLEARHDVKKLH